MNYADDLNAMSVNASNISACKNALDIIYKQTTNSKIEFDLQIKVKQMLFEITCKSIENIHGLLNIKS